MSALGTILRFRALASWNRLRDLHRESILKIAVTTLVGGGLWAGLFFASLRSLAFLDRYPEFRAAVVFTMMALLFMALTVMLIFSNAILSLGSLFRTPETAFLLSVPIPAGSVYAYKVIEGLIFSSWAFMVMGMPPMIAYGLSVSAPWTYYLGILLFFAPFTLMTAAAGTLVGFLVTAMVPRQRGRLVAWVVGSLLVVVLLLGLRLMAAYRGTNVFTEAGMDDVLGKLAFLRNRYVPHFWMTRGLLMLGAGRTTDAVLPLAAMASTSAFVLLLGDFVARRSYAAAWSVASGGALRRRYRRGTLARACEIIASPAGRLSALFVSKDIRIFLRDPAQWSQVAIFFGLLGIYILNLRNLHYDFSKGAWLHLVSTLNFGATSMTLATLTTRFVFPQMSLEGRRFWVLGLAPVPRREILYGKFAFSVGGAFVIAEGLVALSNYMLRMPGEVFVAHAVGIVFICVGLTGLALGMGAVFPDYRETNPSRIVSGFGGTLTLILSIAFVIVIVAILGVLSYHRLVAGTIDPRTFLGWAVAAGLAAAAVTAIAAVVPMAWGVKALERAEF